MEIADVLLFIAFLLMVFTAYQLGKEDGWREGYGDGWDAHKKIGAAIEEINQAVFDAGTTWSATRSKRWTSERRDGRLRQGVERDVFR